MMTALGLGVYSADGSALERGAERSGLDFFVYDFEIDGMALAVDNGVVRTLPQLTLQISAVLTDMGIKPAQPITDTFVARTLLDGVAEAVGNPGDPSTYPLRLVRELTNRGPLATDLASDVDPEDIALGAPAFFLLMAALLLPVVNDFDPVTAGSGKAIASTRMVLAAHPCDVAGSSVIGKFTAAAKWAAWFRDLAGKPAVVKGAIKAADAIRVATISIEAIHGVMIAATVWVDRMSAELQKTHWGHDAPGDPLEFKLRVANFKEYPEALIKCGWLAGLKFPPKGPIDDILVFWSNGRLLALPGGLERHGTLDCPEKGCSVTAGGGIATLRFQPKTEQFVSRLNVEQEQVGYVRAWPMIQLSLGNSSVGVVGGDLAFPKRVYWQWDIKYHLPPFLVFNVRSEIVLALPTGVANTSGRFLLEYDGPLDNSGVGVFKGVNGPNDLRGLTTGPAPVNCGKPVFARAAPVPQMGVRDLQIVSDGGGGARITSTVELGETPQDTMIVPPCPPKFGGSRTPTNIWPGYIIGDRLAQGSAGPPFPIDWTVQPGILQSTNAPRGLIATGEWVGTCRGTCNTITQFRLEVTPRLDVEP